MTAGQAFEVISNDYKVSVVVPYNDEARELLDKLSQDYLEIEEQKKILKNCRDIQLEFLKKEKKNSEMLYMKFAMERYWYCVMDIMTRK